MAKYNVGYKKPPAHSRFKKGKSGNPKGRPKGTKNFLTDLNEEVQERVTVQEAGRRIKISKQRAMVKRLVSAALNGDLKSAAFIVDQLGRAALAEELKEQSKGLSHHDRAIIQQFMDYSEQDNDDDV